MPICSEQDDDADPASDEEMDQLGPSTEQKQRDMDRLVPELPDDQWGRKEETETKVPIAPHELPKPRLEPEKYDGASDSEPSEDDEEEANLQEVGEEGTEGQDINMNEEMHEFLRFTREALGLTEDQYQDILKSRSARGGESDYISCIEIMPTYQYTAFVPGDELTNARPMDMDMPPPPQSTAHTNSTSSTRKPDAPSTQPSSFHLNAPQKNPKLDSFEALMNAMDGALEQAKSQTQQNQKTAATGKSKATDPDDAALEGGMDAELAELLKHDPDDEDDHLNPSQYNLLKNLLASFDSQEGAAGPVSNLAGRLDPNVRLPRNQSA